jgi:hypothetical protein
VGIILKIVNLDGRDHINILENPGTGACDVVFSVRWDVENTRAGKFEGFVAFHPASPAAFQYHERFLTSIGRMNAALLPLIKRHASASHSYCLRRLEDALVFIFIAERD